MVSIDQRTRFAGPTVPMFSDTVTANLTDRLADTSALAARGLEQLGLPTLSLDVDGAALHLAAESGHLVVREGLTDDGLVVALDATAAAELVQDVTSTFGLVMAGRVDVRQGATEDFVAWEPVLRAILDGREVHEPGSIELRDLHGRPLDLERAFGIDEPVEEIGHFLAEAGYLHLANVFTEAEMAAVSADLDVAMAAATEGDGASWWAHTPDGWYASRILGFNLVSPALQELLSSDRFTNLGRLTGDEMVQRPPAAGDSAEGLLKKVGVDGGISDVSWHKDCSMGGHSRHCCGLVVGISVTGADRRSGELGVVAGSHRANVQAIGLRPDLDLPRVPLPTATGDVTVHCTCTLHMSRPPVDRERRVVYTGFGLAPRPGDVVERLDPEEIQRRRASLDDQVRDRERAGAGDRATGFEL